MADALDQARRPLLIAGGMLRGDQGQRCLPNSPAPDRAVAASWKNQDIFDNGSPLYAGHLGVSTPKAHVDTLARADLVIAAGTRLGDIASQNHLPAPPIPSSR